MGDAEKVSAFMAALDHPFKAEIEVLRGIIRTAGPKLGERIKWNGPSYHLGKCDMAAFNLHAKDFVQLVFVFPNGTMIADRRGVLEGDYTDRRLAKFQNMADIERKRPALEVIVGEWIALVEASTSA